VLPVAAQRYVMYFRFVDDFTFFHNRFYGDMLLPLQRRHRSTVNSVLAASMGNESVPKIIINNTINLFLKLQSAFW